MLTGIIDVTALLELARYILAMQNGWCPGFGYASGGDFGEL